MTIVGSTAVIRSDLGLLGTGQPTAGPAWTVGHTLFLVAFLFFGPLVTRLRTLVPRTGRDRWISELATGAARLRAAPAPALLRGTRSALTR